MFRSIVRELYSVAVDDRNTYFVEGKKVVMLSFPPQISLHLAISVKGNKNVSKNILRTNGGLRQISEKDIEVLESIQRKSMELVKDLE